MKHFPWFLVLFLPLLSCQKQPTTPHSFQLHLFSEPQQLDPAKSRASSASYFFFNTMRGLYKIDANNNLQEEGGHCQWTQPLELTCFIKNQKWSDGSAVTSQHYIDGFKHLITPSTAAPRAHLLNMVQGAQKIQQGLLPPEKLGVQTLDSQSFKVLFNEKDHEFKYKLASTALYPFHPSRLLKKEQFRQWMANGPYQISHWFFGKQVTLTPNPHYHTGHKQRPPIVFHFLDDEMTAYRLYEKKKLHFLRRVPTQMIASLQKRTDFIQKPMLRFDYIGFGQQLIQQPKLRKALAHSVDYQQLKKLLGALEQPGCPSIPSGWLVEKKCHPFIENFTPPHSSKTYRMVVSQLGGLDIKRQAEFFQNQWSKNLNLSIEVSQEEQKVFISQLRTSPPDIFRKGVGLDRPTCLNALETFSEDSQQNFITLKDKDYQSILKDLRKTATSDARYKQLCQKGVDFLMNQYLLIPLGEMHFSLMASPLFAGWTINGLNQLDLSQLHQK